MMSTIYYGNLKHNKFMAGIFIVLIIFYFTMFVYIVNSTDIISQHYGLENGVSNATGEFVNDGIVDFDPEGVCQNPRYKYMVDFAAETVDTRPMMRTESLACINTQGVTDNVTCNSIPGCEWEVQSFWFREDKATCAGVVDAAQLGIEVDSSFFGTDIVARHDNSRPTKRVSVCDHPEVVLDEDRCDLFGCTWETDPDTDIGYDNIFNTVTTVFTFNYDFGLENAMLVSILNFLFIGLPMLLLVMSIYFIIPFIH